MSQTAENELVVFIGGVPVGTIVQCENGALSFSYDASYTGIPLSLSMPVSNAVYGDKVVRPFLFGLLPEDAGLRRSLGAEFGVSGNNPFALMRHIGYDCVGAVQIVPFDGLEDVAADACYSAVDEAAIASRLRAIGPSTSAVWQLGSEHWSLGGQQSKIALARFGDGWYECEGSAATTHILKPGIPHLAHQALNEHLCLRLADLCGLPAAKSTYVCFEGIPAIVVKRYDRVVLGPGEVVRLHQEDMCQALSVLPEKKYPSDGGPSARDVMALLGSHPHARSNKLVFAAQLFFNYLVGAPDAHAKNFSVLLHDESGPILSPLYDVASGLPYDYSRYQLRTAMSIGGENRVGRLKKHHVQNLAEAFDLDDGRLVDLMLNLADAVIASLPRLEEEALACEGGAELSGRLMPELRVLGEDTIRSMS